METTEKIAAKFGARPSLTDDGTWVAECPRCPRSFMEPNEDALLVQVEGEWAYHDRIATGHGKYPERRLRA